MLSCVRHGNCDRGSELDQLNGTRLDAPACLLATVSLMSESPGTPAERWMRGLGISAAIFVLGAFAATLLIAELAWLLKP